MLANPNNPTGTLFTADQFDAFWTVCRKTCSSFWMKRIAITFSIRTTRARWIACALGAKLLVLRTFSKAHGLAGLRIGYGIGPDSLLVEMNKVRTPFNTTGVAQAAALAAIGDVEHVRRSVELNREGHDSAFTRARTFRYALCPLVWKFYLF